MMPEFRVIDGPTRSGVSSRIESSLNSAFEPFLGQFDAVALDAREADFERVALRPHGLDLNRLARRLRRSDDRLGGEVERNAEDVGIFDVEQPFFVQVVGLAAQGAADDLLAQQLRAEGADAEDVGDGVGVPAFGEHRNRDDAADGAAELSRLADRVHDLAEQFLASVMFVGLRRARRCARRSRGGSARSRRRHACGNCRRARRRLRAARCRSAACSGAASGLPCLVEVAEQGEAAVLQRGRAVFVLAMKAGDVVVDQLRDGRVLADDDEAGRHPDACFLPELEGLLVVAVEGFERGLQVEWEA